MDDDIIRMAREAGLMAWNGDCVLTDGQLERFFLLAAAAGAAAERERIKAEPVCPDCRGLGYDASGQLCACQENPSFG